MKLTLFLTGLFLLPNMALGSTWYVPDDFPRIQDAINTSSNGDTIIVRPGTYLEIIDFIGMALNVQSEAGPQSTIIDGNQSGSVVTFQSGEGPDSVLDGFTITNGTGTKITNWQYVGAGIYCHSSSPTVSNNIIYKNTAGNDDAGLGGGIYCFESSPTIKSNVIKENIASGYNSGGHGEGYGGGIYCEASNPIIVDNIIEENGSIGGGWESGFFYGGGICCESSDPIIVDNIIKGNRAGGVGAFMSEEDSGFGGGISCESSNPIIVGNVIEENCAGGNSNYDYEGFGGGIFCNASSNPIVDSNVIKGNTVLRYWGSAQGAGIYCSDHSSPTITNNTMVENTAVDDGGGIFCTGYSSPTITNTILWDNSAQSGQEIWIGETSFPSTLTINYSDVKGGQSSCYVDPICTLNWGAGMIDADPLFVDSANGDFHLTYPSPCKDTGDNTAVTGPYDFEGDPRIANSTVDMGVDEFHRHLYYTGDAAPGCSVDLKFINMPGSSPVGFWISFDTLETPIHCGYGDWYLAFPVYGPWLLPPIPSNGIEVISGTLPSTPPGPYDIHFQAIMGTPMRLTNLCTMHVE